MNINSSSKSSIIVLIMLFQINLGVLGQDLDIDKKKKDRMSELSFRVVENLLHDNLQLGSDSSKISREVADDEGATGKNENIEMSQLPIFPSPKVAALMKYTDFPEVDQHGVIPIQIPIYNIDLDDISHSIYLNYHAGGIKVNQEATWVGLGWDIVAGGSISRVVMDLPDDEVRVYSYNVPGNPGYTVNVSEFGWLDNPDFIKDFPELDLNTDSYKNSLYIKWDQQGESGNAGIALKFIDYSNRLHEKKKRDCEPDIYHISIGDINEKFVIDFNGVPRLINPKKDIKITYLQSDPTSESRITGFVIKDMRGNEYSFGGAFIEKTTILKTISGGCSSGIGSISSSNIPEWTVNCYGDYQTSTSYNSVWYLEKVKSPKQNIINFLYAKPLQILTLDVPVVKCQTINSLGFENPWNSIVSIKKEIESLYLDYIEFQGNVIDFEISMREDVLNGFRLDRLSVKESLQSINAIYQFDFEYYYMNPGGTYKDKRLMLNKLIENQNKKFIFDYYDGSLPLKESYKQDFWGHYSTKSNSLIPKIYVYPEQNPENQFRCFPIAGESNFTLIDGSDRTVDETAILSGVLKTITYPSGGSTLFEFEPNEYYDPLYDSNIKGGGIRISQILKRDVNNDILQKKSYRYDLNNRSSGILVYDLAFATPTNFTPYNNSSNHYYLWEHTDWPESKKSEYFTVRFTHNQYPSGNMDGYSVGYTNVEICEEGNGKIVKEYYPPQNYKENSPTVNTSPMNAWGFSFFDASLGQNLIPQNNGIMNKYTKRCVTYNNEPAWQYYSPFAGTSYEPTSSCSSLDNKEVFTDDGMNYYGGHGGFFHPTQYLPISLYVDPIWIFDYAHTGYRAYHTWIMDYGDILIQDGFITDKSAKGVNFSDNVPGLVVGTGKNIFPFPPLSINSDDELVYSKLKSERYYKEGNIDPVKTKQYYYLLQGTLNESVFGIVFGNQYTVPWFIKASPLDAAEFDAGLAYFLTTTHSNYIQRKSWAKYYYKTSATAVLDYIIETDFFNGKAVENVINYEYTNHLLVSNITEVQSNNKIKENVFKYPFNYNNGIYAEMTSDNMLMYPVEKLEKVDNGVTDGSITTYRYDDGIIIPDVNYKFASSTPIQQAECEYNGSLPGSEYWFEYIYFIDYVQGHLVNYHKNNEYETTILWGYNYTLPIAKIENATYDLVKSELNALGHTIESLQNKTDSQLRQIFFNLRTRPAMKDAMITSFTHKRLVGMTSETDPAGMNTFYEYDNFGRLQYIKNHEGHYIKEFEYHYGEDEQTNPIESK